jgi:hypothetical protein
VVASGFTGYPAPSGQTLVGADSLGTDCLDEAPSAAAIAEMAEAAGLEAERIVEALADDEGGLT